MQPGQICHVDLRPGVSDGEICQVDMRPEAFRSHVRSHVAMRYDLGSGAIYTALLYRGFEPCFERKKKEKKP